MKLSEMKQVLAAEGTRLTKSLGQNFLHDANQLHRIIAAAQLTPEDKVLEIGPGLGPLTELLLREAGHVLAIEKDQRLVQFLRRRFGQSPKLDLRHGDGLEFVAQHRRAEVRRPGFSRSGRQRADSSGHRAVRPAEAGTPNLAPDLTDWKVVSNLPYSVASPILVDLARSPTSPRMIVATLQLEVAQRIGAEHGSKEYGLLSLLMQLRYELRGQFKIPASCFFPEPDVDSACITLVRRAQAWLDDKTELVFERIVKRAFSQRRKMMLKLLKEDWPEDRLGALFDELRIDRRARAETVSLNQFADLSRKIS